VVPRSIGISLVPVFLLLVVTGHVAAQADSLLIPSDTSYFRAGEPDWNLVEAVIREDPANVLHLLKRGADPDARASGGITALMFATENSDTLSMKILLLNGADPDLTYVEKTTPLLVAVLNHHFEAAHLLLSFGADPNLKDSYGVPPLVYAAAMNDYPMADLLIYYGADREAADSEGNTPLMTATGMGYLETADVLLQNGSQTENKDTLGFTPLMVASQHGDTALVRLLLEYGALKEAVNEDNYTPLALAVSAGQVEAARVLVDSGAQVNHQVSNGKHIADLALRSRSRELIQILEDAGAVSSSKPDFSEFQVAWGNSFNGADHMMQARMRLQDTKFRFYIETGYDVRPILRKVQIRQNDTLVYQYRESMSAWTHGIGKEFRLTGDGNQASFGLYTSLSGMLSFPRHRGVRPHPSARYLVVPAAGIFVNGRLAGIRAGAERYTFGTLKENPWKFNVTLFLRVPLDHTQQPYKTMPY